MGRGLLYLGLTAILLACCGPIGLIPLWLGPWSRRTKLVVSLVWLVIYGPAVWFYLSQMYHR